MKFLNKFTGALCALSIFAVAGCTEGPLVSPDDPNQKTKNGAMIGAAAGAVLGALTSSDEKRGAVKGALIGAGVGGISGALLDKQEADLRQELGNGATIQNTGDRLIVTMAQDILFATGSATLRPDINRDIRAVAGSLQAYPNSTVQVIGHTDNVGDAGYNFDLSLRRGQAVTQVLASEGVTTSRMQAVGRGEDQPVASNLTPEGRQQNRRVEIVIVPTS
ncbi:OmpA family protein [Lentibacter algarum]|uniref:OmpA family protein n=1 Tax=Lentibacter algarum TaxID=576131 RepID=UPI001C07CC3D|nr:OmpA family protein [Lentibacter algarum]MBU2980403.1 OmpA family protein [Lentibacter algarum]